jgi:hypothetical protein
MSPFEEWMVRRNVEHANSNSEGAASVVDRLRANGYHRVADEVAHRVKP